MPCLYVYLSICDFHTLCSLSLDIVIKFDVVCIFSYDIRCFITFLSQVAVFELCLIALYSASPVLLATHLLVHVVGPPEYSHTQLLVDLAVSQHKLRLHDL